MNQIGLDALISPASTESFFKNNWLKKPFVVHDLKDTVRSLTELPFLQSLDALLSSWQDSVQVHLPDRKDESSSIDVNPKVAFKLFSNQMALLFNNAEKQSSILKNWLNAMTSDLGLPASTHARCMVYVTPDGKGTATHFDQNVNFVLQLHGTKKWCLAENLSVKNPTERHTQGHEIDSELASYVDSELVKEIPRYSEEIILSPGSMLFVPRGWWHSTEAAGQAMALNFTFSQPSWADLFLMALRSRLVLSSQWRELADQVNSLDSLQKEIAVQKFNILLLDLVEDLPNWRAEDILNATEGWNHER